jgi:molybdenum ABC transporter, periplasmic molybdate-binding protein
MKRLKKVLLLAALAAFIISMSAVSVFAAATPVVSVDGTAITIDSGMGTPFIDSANRTQVPINAFSKSLGAKDVSWDQATQTATIDGTVKIKVGASTISTAYGTITMDTQAVNKDGRIYVPARYIANALGYDIEGTSKDGVITANVITKVDLTISAAASLKSALDEIQTLYKAEKPNATLAISYGGSGTLQQQIEQGAPVDVFLSAATSNMKALKDKSLLDDSTMKNLLQNKVVLIVPSDSKAKIASFEDVKNADIKKIALGEPTTVPAGKYAEQIFTYYNMLDAVKAKVVYAKDVTEVRTFVESGNVDAGVVYSTDAMVSGDKVKIVATAAEGSHDPVTYPGAVIKATKHAAASKDFLNYLSTDAAKAVFVKYGFSVL